MTPRTSANAMVCQGEDKAMPSSQIDAFMASSPGTPGFIPVDELKQFRAEGIVRMTTRWPALPDVEQEPAVHEGVDVVWYRPPDAEGDHVVLYVHGGAFMYSSAASHGGVISRLAKQSRLDHVALDYDVAPFCPFPGQIMAGVRLYRHLLAQGYRSEKIAFVGDSAGGGLVLSILYALKQAGDRLPACAAVSSSYLDLANTGESIDWVQNDPCVTLEGLETCVGHYLQGHDPKDPLASPLYADVAGFPPLLLQAGSREKLLSDTVRMASKADAAGVQTKLEVYDGCVHLWHWWVPDSPEADAAITSICNFVRGHLRL